MRNLSLKYLFGVRNLLGAAQGWGSSAKNEPNVGGTAQTMLAVNPHRQQAAENETRAIRRLHRLNRCNAQILLAPQCCKFRPRGRPSVKGRILEGRCYAMRAGYEGEVKHKRNDSLVALFTRRMSRMHINW